MTLVAGTLLGPYEVLAPLGAGGMGEVYRARDSRLGREVAVKVLPDVFACRPDRLVRFEREARAAGALTHPNILAVHDVGSHEGRPYVVFELLDGMTLRTRLHNGDRLTVRKSLEIASQAGHGLDAAHAKGIVHRDLKPENLFLTTDGVVKVLDFGLAKLQDEADTVADSGVSTQSQAPWRTEAGALLGTAGYMSPEQVRGNAVDHRSDLFALGAVLYEMLAESPAFYRGTRPETLLAILSEDPPDLAAKRPGLSPAVVGVVRRCLEKDPADRYQSARDLAFTLENLLSGTDSLSNRRSSRAGVRARALPKRLRAWALALVASLALAAAGIWFVRRSPDPPPLGTPRQITTDPGIEREPALSPDGSLVAFTTDRSGNDDIWMADVRSGEPVQLTNDPASDSSPAWLPDGSAVLFTSDRGGSTGIWKVPRLGGAAVLVVENAWSAAVSPDGKWLAFARGASGASRIARAPLADPSASVFLTGEKDGLLFHDRPTWSPDGTRICYADFRDLWIVPVSGGGARPLTHAHAADDHPAWSPDGSEIVFSSGREGTLALWSVAPSGGEPRRLTLGTGPEVEPSFSRQGARMAYSTVNSFTAGDVAVLELRSRQLQRISGVRHAAGPAFSPDGRTVVFSSNRQGVYDLWAQGLEGGRPIGPVRQLTDSLGNKSCATFSPDGRWIAFQRVLDGQRDLWAIPVATGAARRLTDHPAQDMYPAFSPDGSRLAFVSDRAGSLDVWVMSFAENASTGPVTKLTSGPAIDYAPWWSPDGRSVAFARAEGQAIALWLVSADGQHEPRRLLSAPNASAVRWIGEGLFAAARWGGKAPELRRVDPVSGEATPLDPAVALGEGGLFDISRDGARVAFDDRPTRGDIWVLDRGPVSKR